MARLRAERDDWKAYANALNKANQNYEKQRKKARDTFHDSYIRDINTMRDKDRALTRAAKAKADRDRLVGAVHRIVAETTAAKKSCTGKNDRYSQGVRKTATSVISAL